MNLKEISWQEAEALEPGTKLFVGQTREKAVEGTWDGDGWRDWEGRWWNQEGVTCRIFNLTPYIPTPDPVDISPSEAAARMVEGLPVEKLCKASRWVVLHHPSSFPKLQSAKCSQFRIPVCPPAKQKLTIEVDAGVEVPDEFTVWPGHLIADRVHAKVIHREAK